MRTSKECFRGNCRDCHKKRCSCMHHTETDIRHAKDQIEQRHKDSATLKARADEIVTDETWSMSTEGWFNDYGYLPESGTTNESA